MTCLSMLLFFFYKRDIYLRRHFASFFPALSFRFCSTSFSFFLILKSSWYLYSIASDIYTTCCENVFKETFIPFSLFFHRQNTEEKNQYQTSISVISQPIDDRKSFVKQMWRRNYSERVTESQLRGMTNCCIIMKTLINVDTRFHSIEPTRKALFDGSYQWAFSSQFVVYFCHPCTKK